MKKMVINRNGVDEVVEYPNEEAKKAFLSKNEKCVEKHTCKMDLVRVKNQFLSDGQEVIRVLLDCSCDKDKFESVAIFENNSLISAKENFKGWFKSVSSYLIENDYRIIDERKYSHES